MRDTLAKIIAGQEFSHFGHAYDVLAPAPAADGKIEPTMRNQWLARCERIAVSPDYGTYFQRWRASFLSEEARMREVTARSRILIGHGNPSGADVGLTVHRSWGVPVLPGSALKGLVAHYVDAVYGDRGEPERRIWLGPTLRQGRVAAADGAGDAYAVLFGAPEADDDGNSARGGLVEFHDALYVPGSAGGRPFARDVLTVHQKQYYDSNAPGPPRTPHWPNDWDSPNPVAFVTVKPQTQFLLALTGPDAWTDLAMKLLLDALSEWGIGGKTSAGYGRLVLPGTRR